MERTNDKNFLSYLYKSGTDSTIASQAPQARGQTWSQQYYRWSERMLSKKRTSRYARAEAFLRWSCGRIQTKERAPRGQASSTARPLTLTDGNMYVCTRASKGGSGWEEKNESTQGARKGEAWAESCRWWWWQMNESSCGDEDDNEEGKKPKRYAYLYFCPLNHLLCLVRVT